MAVSSQCSAIVLDPLKLSELMTLFASLLSQKVEIYHGFVNIASQSAQLFLVSGN
jgi:hypothetical protein